MSMGSFFKFSNNENIALPFFVICILYIFLTHLKIIFVLCSKNENLTLVLPDCPFQPQQNFFILSSFLTIFMPFIFFLCWDNFGIVPGITIRQINVHSEIVVFRQTCLQQMNPTSKFQRHFNCILITF